MTVQKWQLRAACLLRWIYINIQRCVSQTQQIFIVFIKVLGQHVSILIESSSDPSKKIDLYLEMLKCAVGSFLSKDLLS